MRVFIILIFAVFFMLAALPAAALGPVPPGDAGPPGAKGEVLAAPVCFNVISRAPYTVFGTIVTDYYTNERGQQARHRSNFRLQSGESAEFCSSGPFYPGRRLELILRSLIPLFNCKTSAEQDVVIYGRRKPEGGTETWAECH